MPSSYGPTDQLDPLEVQRRILEGRRPRGPLDRPPSVPPDPYRSDRIILDNGAPPAWGPDGVAIRDAMIEGGSGAGNLAGTMSPLDLVTPGSVVRALGTGKALAGMAGRGIRGMAGRAASKDAGAMGDAILGGGKVAPPAPDLPPLPPRTNFPDEEVFSNLENAWMSFPHGAVKTTPKGNGFSVNLRGSPSWEPAVMDDASLALLRKNEGEAGNEAFRRWLEENQHTPAKGVPAMSSGPVRSSAWEVSSNADAAIRMPPESLPPPPSTVPGRRRVGAPIR